MGSTETHNPAQEEGVTMRRDDSCPVVLLAPFFFIVLLDLSPHQKDSAPRLVNTSKSVFK